MDEPDSNSPSKLCIGVGNGIKLVELGGRIGVSLGSSLTNSFGVRTSHVSICDCHFAGLVTVDPVRYWEVMFLVCKLYALDQPT